MECFIPFTSHGLSINVKVIGKQAEKSTDDQSACNSTPVWRKSIRKHHHSWMICRAEAPKLRESMRFGPDDLCGQVIFFPLIFLFFPSRLCSISKMAHVHPSCFQPLANLNQLPDQKYLRGITLQHSHLVASPLWSLRASPTPLLCHRCGTKWKLSRLKSDFFHDDKWGKKKNQKKPDLGYEIKRQCVSLCVFMSYLMTGNVIMNGSDQMWLAAVVMWRFDFQTALAGNVNPDVLIHKPTAREINAGFFSWGCDWKSI